MARSFAGDRKPISTECPYRSRASKGRKINDPEEEQRRQFTCNLLALFRKSLIINGAGEGNRTLVSGCPPKGEGRFSTLVRDQIRQENVRKPMCVSLCQKAYCECAHGALHWFVKREIGEISQVERSKAKYWRRESESNLPGSVALHSLSIHGRFCPPGLKAWMPPPASSSTATGGKSSKLYWEVWDFIRKFGTLLSRYSVPLLMYSDNKVGNSNQG